MYDIITYILNKLHREVILIDLKTLPIETQYHLERLLNGTTTKQNVSRLKCDRKSKHNFSSAFNLGLAIYVYTLLKEYEENNL